MLSKQQISYLRSLQQKKFRQMYGKFPVEGDKLVRELLTSNYKTDAIFRLKSWNGPLTGKETQQFEVTEGELSKISSHESPNQVLAVAEIPLQTGGAKIEAGETGPFIVCDNLNDPGNAGAIIRSADWFGINRIFFSNNSVDIYNPKCVSAAKGSLFRVNCTYVDLPQLFNLNKAIPVYGAFMDGESIYTAKLESKSFIVIGNEANGINEDLLPYVKRRISIPPFGKAESLNAAVAAAIIMNEFKRNS